MPDTPEQSPAVITAFMRNTRRELLKLLEKNFDLTDNETFSNIVVVMVGCSGIPLSEIAGRIGFPSSVIPKWAEGSMAPGKPYIRYQTIETFKRMLKERLGPSSKSAQIIHLRPSPKD